MAKPIFCMEFPIDMPFQKRKEFHATLESRLTDYHVISYCGNSDDFKVTVLSEQNTTNGDLTEIVEYIKEKLQQ